VVNIFIVKLFFAGLSLINEIVNNFFYFPVNKPLNHMSNKDVVDTRLHKTKLGRQCAGAIKKYTALSK